MRSHGIVHGAGSRRRGARPVLAVLAGCLLAAALARGAAAQELTATPPAPAGAAASSEPSPWALEVIPFLWLPETQGTIGARGLTAHVDVDFGKVFELLGNGELFAAGGQVEARYDRFSILLSAFGGTARPSSDITIGAAQRPGTADVTMNFTFFEFGPTYRLLDWPLDGPGRPIRIDFLTGGRFMYFYQSIDVRGSGGLFQRSANATSSWVDPFVGGRFSVPLTGDLDCLFRGDIGGFGAGSKLAWNVVSGFGYALPWQPFGARTALYAVYKALDFDYQAGAADKTITAKLDFRGPAFGLGFQF